MTDDSAHPGLEGHGVAEHRRYRPNRFATLADGIFAIAMTLLALEIQVPEDLTDKAAYGDQMGPFLSSLGVFVVAFLITAQYWSGNHRVMSYVHTLDRRALSLGLYSLLGIAALPAAARLLTGAHGYWQAIAAAAAVLAATSLLSTRFYAHVLRPEYAEIEPLERRQIVVAPLVNVGVYVLTIALTLILHVTGGVPATAFTLWFLLPLNRVITRLVTRRRAPAPSRSSG